MELQTNDFQLNGVRDFETEDFILRFCRYLFSKIESQTDLQRLKRANFFYSGVIRTLIDCIANIEQDEA